MDKGRVLTYGPTSEVISAYLKSGLGTTAAREWEASDAPGDGAARLRAVRVRTASGEVSDRIDIREPVGIEVEFEVFAGAPAVVPNMDFTNSDGTMLFIACDWDPHWRSTSRPPGRYTRTVWVAGNFFAEGTIVVSAALSSFHPSVTVHGSESDAVAFEVVDSAEGDSARGDYTGAFPGAIRPMVPWSDEPRIKAGSGLPEAHAIA